MRLENMFFSIILPIYNVEKYLKECVDSIQAQTFKDYEIILVDDGSTDSTVEVVSRFIEENGCNGWRLFLNEENKGYCKNFLEGVLMTLGDYVFFCGNFIIH